MITGAPDAYQVTGDPLIIKREVVETTTAIVERVEKAKKAKIAKKAASAVLKINAGIAKMTKAKIEEHGRELGVELDRRMTKPNMIKDLKSKLK